MIALFAGLLLPVAAITVSEIWPYAAAAGTVISTIVGAFYLNLLTQIRDLKAEKKVLEEINATYVKMSVINPEAVRELAAAIREMSDTIEDRMPTTAPPITRRGTARGGD